MYACSTRCRLPLNESEASPTKKEKGEATWRLTFLVRVRVVDVLDDEGAALLRAAEGHRLGLQYPRVLRLVLRLQDHVVVVVEAGCRGTQPKSRQCVIINNLINCLGGWWQVPGQRATSYAQPPTWLKDPLESPIIILQFYVQTICIKCDFFWVKLHCKNATSLTASTSKIVADGT